MGREYSWDPVHADFLVLMRLNFAGIFSLKLKFHGNSEDIRRALISPVAKGLLCVKGLPDALS